MKKIICLIILICLTVCAFTAAGAESVKLAYKGGSLNLRTGAGTNYGINGYVHNGDSITVLEKGSSWSKIRVSDGRIGYIKNLYISGNGSLYADGTSYYSGSKKGTITTKYSGSTVNLRAGASTSTKSMGSVKSGESVRVLGENGSWYLIEKKDGTQGFVYKTYVSTSGVNPSVSVKAKVTGSVVYMRAGAGTKYSPVTMLSKGTVVKVLSTSNSKWWKVSYGSYTGYMSSRYLKKI